MISELTARIEEVRALRRQAVAEADALVTSVYMELAGARTRKLGDIIVLDEDEVQVAATTAYPQVGVRGFGGGLFAKATLVGAETTYRAFHRLFAGALVLSQVKGWEGAVAVCPAELSGWFVSPEYRTFRCVSSEARPTYLAGLVRTHWFWSKLADAARGVGARRERTRPERFLEIELAMPGMDRQTRGERIFAEINALASLQNQATGEMGAVRPAVLARTFEGQL